MRLGKMEQLIGWNVGKGRLVDGKTGPLQALGDGLAREDRFGGNRHRGLVLEEKIDQAPGFGNEVRERLKRRKNIPVIGRDLRVDLFFLNTQGRVKYAVEGFLQGACRA